MTELLVKLFIHNADNINDPNVRKRFGILSGTVGIICNTVLFLAKLFVGIVTSSIAVSADAFNNLSDAGSSILTLACFKIAGAPADREHPFGHGRVEYISGLIMSAAIILTGLSFIKSSVIKIFNPEPTTFSLISLFILILSLMLKLWMGLFNKKLSAMVNSSAMKAASIDSLVDVAATSTVIISMIITRLTNMSVDAYAGLIVAIFILLTGISMIKETLGPLLGQAPDPELVKEINKLVLSHDEIVGIHELMVHNYGPGRSIISLHAEMPANINIFELHDVIDTIENELKNKFNCQTIIHLDPITTDDEIANSLRIKISELAKLIHPNAKIYDLRVVPGTAHSTVIFDLSIPYDLKQSNTEIVDSFKKGVNIIDESYECIINLKRDYLSPDIVKKEKEEEICENPQP